MTLYDLLIKGDKSRDVPLLPEDVVYFLPVGPQVALGGQVNTPAIYELKGETTMAELFAMAGGLSNTAFGGKVFVEEIQNRSSRRVEEVPLDAAGLARPMKDGDVLNVTPLSPKFENAVTLRGNVASPGRYPWHEGMRISDLIPSREFLVTRDYYKQQNQVTLESQSPGAKPSAAQNDVRRTSPDINWDYAVVQRMDPQDLSTRLIPFNLGKAVLEHDGAEQYRSAAGRYRYHFFAVRFARARGEADQVRTSRWRVWSGRSLSGERRTAAAGSGARGRWLDPIRVSLRCAVQPRIRASRATEAVEPDDRGRRAQSESQGGTIGDDFDHHQRIGIGEGQASRRNGTSLDLLRRIQPDGRIVLNLASR